MCSFFYSLYIDWWIYLIIQALKKFIEGDAILILDPRLERSAATNLAVEKILELSLSCVASNRHNRPTMRKCAEILWTIRKDHREHAVSYPHSLPSNVSAGADWVEIQDFFFSLFCFFLDWILWRLTNMMAGRGKSRDSFVNPNDHAAERI